MLYFSKLKIFSIFIVILIGFIFFIPNFVNHEYFNKNIKKFNLGLDLQGGSYLLLEIDSKPLVQQKIQNKILEIKKELKKNKISYSSFNLNNKIVSFDIKSNSDKILLVLNKNKINYLPDGSKEFNIEQNNGKIILNFSNNFISNIKKNALEQSLEIVRNRIDEIGTKEPTIIAQGKDRILVELPGLRDPSGIKSLLGKTAKLTFRFLVNNEKAEFGFELLNDKSNNEKKYKVEKKIIVSGENLIDAQPGFDQTTNSSVVNFKLDTFGAKKFAFITKKNIGRFLAIIIDDEVVSAPVIRDAITTGNGQISGNFTVKEANDLAILLRAGSLPAPIRVLEERTVGPSLGIDSIEAGKKALLIGFVLVIVFMILRYKAFGLVADFAIIFNVIFQLNIIIFISITF